MKEYQDAVRCVDIALHLEEYHQTLGVDAEDTGHFAVRGVAVDVWPSLLPPVSTAPAAQEIVDVAASPGVPVTPEGASVAAAAVTEVDGAAVAAAAGISETAHGYAYEEEA